MERCVLMEGALKERLKREYQIEFNEFVDMGALIYDTKSKQALKVLWNQYLDIARRYDLEILLTTPTRRANKERIEKAAYDEELLVENVKFLKEVAKDAKAKAYIGGLMGCKGDAYTGEGALSQEEAKAFHSWQANALKVAGVDFLYAGIMPTLPEACGMAKALSDTGLPYIMSFTIRKDGKLIDGTTIHDAIAYIDAHTLRKPACYMSNCVHPDIVYEALTQPCNQSELVKERFKGIQANTSPLDYDLLDQSEELQSSDPEALAKSMARLKTLGLQIFGGCCGTNEHHMEEIAKMISTMA